MADLCVLANGVKQSDITLVTGNGKPPRFGGCSSREVVLAGVLLELAVHKLVAGQTRVDAEDAVVSYMASASCLRTGVKHTVTDQSLLGVHLGIL